MEERYLGIRVDCPKSQAPHILTRLASVIEKLGTIVRGTYGHEVSVKAKKEHFHWHIQLSSPAKLPKALSKWIKSAYDKEDPLSDPLHHYAIKVLDTPDDVNRFFRYPFKDLDSYEASQQVGFHKEDLDKMMTQATTEREIALKTFEKHENKLNNDKQNRALLWEYLDAELPNLKLTRLNPDHSYDPCRLVATAIVQYNITYNDCKVPMDLKRRTLCYLAHRGLLASLIADRIW